MPEHTHARITASELKDMIRDEILWQSPDHAWEADAIIGGTFLRAIVELAARAPGYEKRKFLRRFGLMNGITGHGR